MYARHVHARTQLDEEKYKATPFRANENAREDSFLPVLGRA